MQTIANNTNLMVKILEGLRNQHKLECNFEQRMRQVQENFNWNESGIYSPYTSVMDYTHFGVSEQGVIRGGAANESVNLKHTMRCLWKTMEFTGALARIKDEQFVPIKEQYGDRLNAPQIESLAENRAIEIQMAQNALSWQRIKNFYAVNGGDKSPIGTVTGAPSGAVVPFAWTTDQGNRFFHKGMQIQFYDLSATTLRNLSAHYTSPRSASEQWSQVTVEPDKSAAVNISNSGAVAFDMLPTTALAAGDTAHAIGLYGLGPIGFLGRVSDTGTVLGESGNLNRSDYSDFLRSTIQDNSSNTDNTPGLMQDMYSLMKGKLSPGEPTQWEIWMNKAQTHRYVKFAMNSPASAALQFNIQRFTDPGMIKGFDAGISDENLTFRNIPIMENVDVPPSKNLWINWLGWMIDTKTPDSIYNFDQNQLLKNLPNSYGEITDAKMLTMYGEYNYRCENYKTQGYQDDLAYEAAQIAYN